MVIWELVCGKESVPTSNVKIKKKKYDTLNQLDWVSS